MATLSRGLAEVRRLAGVVNDDGACSLPGISIDYSKFVDIMTRAVSRSYVDKDKAEYVKHGLRFGFMVGVDPNKLIGKRRFRNYPTALEAKAAVSDATKVRVDAGKTLQLFPFTPEQRGQLPWPAWRRGRQARDGSFPAARHACSS